MYMFLYWRCVDVLYGSSVFSSGFAITERSEMFMSLFGFEIGMMFASFHV